MVARSKHELRARGAATLVAGRQRHFGFTALELSITTGLFALAAIAIWQLFANTSEAAKFGVWTSDLDRTVRKLFDTFIGEVKESGADESGTNHVLSHPPTQSQTRNTLDFDMRIDFDGGADDWGPTITYALEPSPGETAGNLVDDDGDGIVDEQQLVRRQSGVTDAIADGVVTFLVTRTANEDKLTFVVRVVRSLARGTQVIERTLNACVALRNRVSPVGG